MDYIKNKLFDDSNKNLNILELGPCIEKDRKNLIKYSFENNHNYFCIDLLNPKYKTDEKNTALMINKYNINAEFKSYTDLLKNPTEDSIKEFKVLKSNFFDVIFTRGSINEYQMEGICKLSEIVGKKKNCKCFFIPWLNRPGKSKEYYNNLIKNLKLPHGYKIYGNNDNYIEYKKLYCKMTKNIVITKNIIIP